MNLNFQLFRQFNVEESKTTPADSIHARSENLFVNQVGPLSSKVISTLCFTVSRWLSCVYGYLIIKLYIYNHEMLIIIFRRGSKMLIKNEMNNFYVTHQRFRIIFIHHETMRSLFQFINQLSASKDGSVEIFRDFYFVCFG